MTKRKNPMPPRNSKNKDAVPSSKLNNDTEEHIKKNLDLVLKTAQSEHQNVVYNTWATQNAKLHTYLWLSVAIISAESALILRVVDSNITNDLNIISLILLFISIVIEFISFVFGIDSMRSRDNVSRPIYGDYNYVIGVAKEDFSGVRVREEAITALENSILGQIKGTNFLGKRMRTLAWLNIASASIGALAFIFYIASSLRCF